MERKIGEIFEYNGEWYQCLKSTSCDECAFVNSNCINYISLKCSADERTDNCSVIFKKLEKVGEPIEFTREWHFQKYQLADSTAFYEGEAHLVFTAPIKMFVYIEIKQNKEDMEEKKIQLSQEEYEHVKNLIENHILPGKLHKEVYEDEVTEQIMRLFSVDANYSNFESIGKNLRSFDLQKAREGKPVCTRDGRKARIICFDKGGEQPIVALIEKNEEESIDTFFNNGHSVSKTNEVAGDLMMLPEKKEGWVNVDKCSNGDVIISKPCPTRDEAIHNSTELTIDTVILSWNE